jgi:hypothetical protein
MKALAYIITGIILMLVESSLSSHLPMDLFKPDVATPFIIYATLFIGSGSGLSVALCTGLFQEGLSGSPNGAILFVTLTLFLVTAFMKKHLYIDSKYSFASLCFVAVLFESFLFLILSIFAKGEAKNIFNILFYAIPNALVTGFISILIYTFIEYLNSTYLDRE